MSLFRSIKLIAANNLSFLGPVKRTAVAFLDSRAPLKASYSQHGEDAWILKELSGLDLSDGMYVEIGANHPTTISNTYLLYRHGFRGIVIEPNLELLSLHRRVRPKDIQIGVGCGSESGIAKFHLFSTPVASSFDIHHTERVKDAKVLRVDYLPILTLDALLKSFPHKWVYFLSIDTEGFDYQVILGAKETLKKTLWLCVETNDEKSERELKAALENDFELVKRFSCNMIFRNRYFAGNSNGKHKGIAGR